MATITTNISAGANAGAHKGYFASLAERYRKWRLYRETVNELNQLSSAELRDLGLSRSGLRSVAYEAVYMKNGR